MKIRWLILFGALCVGGLAPATSGQPELAFPVACRVGVSCEIQNYVDRDPGPKAEDYRCGTRTYDAHNGVDIRILDLAAQRRGVAVVAAAPGKVTRLRDGVEDISVKSRGANAVSGQECGNGVVINHGRGWETQYCHLARNSLRVSRGAEVRAGQPIALIGLSGNTEYPHLHITVRHNGVVVDPFATGRGCEASGSPRGMWAPEATRQMRYRVGVVLNSGFTTGPPDAAAVEAGDLALPHHASPSVVAYIRAIGLSKGDVQELTLVGPDGKILARNQLPGLDRDKAQYLLYAGRKRSGSGWPSGTFKAEYILRRNGALVLRHSFQQPLASR